VRQRKRSESRQLSIEKWQLPNAICNGASSLAPPTSIAGMPMPVDLAPGERTEDKPETLAPDQEFTRYSGFKLRYDQLAAAVFTIRLG
jgi:hypothetical protein